MQIKDVIGKFNTAFIEVRENDLSGRILGRDFLSSGKLTRIDGVKLKDDDKALSYRALPGQVPLVTVSIPARKGFAGVVRAILGLDEDTRPFLSILLIVLLSFLYIFKTFNIEYLTLVFTMLSLFTWAALVKTAFSHRNKEAIGISDYPLIPFIVIVFALGVVIGAVLLLLNGNETLAYFSAGVSFVLLFVSTYLYERGMRA